MIKPTDSELRNAFENSKLRRLGYSFERAMNTQALKVCIERLAVISIKKLNPSLQVDMLEAA